jgi:UDP-glucose 4-epimerase
VTVVAITGASSGLGRCLLQQVQCDPEVTRILVIDEAPPPEGLQGDRVAFVRRGPVESWNDVFVQHAVDTAIHFALGEPLRDRAREELVNVGGARRFLDAAHASNAQTVCVVTSAAGYGAKPDNADYLFEGAPLRADARFPHAADAVRIEGLCYEHAAKHPDACLTIARCSPVIGPAMGGFWLRLFERRRYWAPIGHEPVLQLVHEDDATRAIWRLVKRRAIGVFNIAGDGYVTVSQAARLLDRRLIRVPLLLLRLLAWLAWRLGRSEVAPGFIDYLVHPWLVNPTKIKAEAMFVFRYDSARALLDWLEARDEAARGVSRVAIPTLDDEDFDELDAAELEDLPPDAVEAPPAPTEEPKPPEAPEQQPVADQARP